MNRGRRGAGIGTTVSGPDGGPLCGPLAEST